MSKLSVCIEMFWRERPFAERIGLAAGLGYDACEFWDWAGKDLSAIRAACEEHDVRLAALCHAPAQGLVKRGYGQELVAGMVQTVEVAHQLDCRTVIVTTGNTLDDESYEITRRRVVRHLCSLAAVAEDNGLTLVLEPLNTLVNHHGYWLTKMSQAADIVQEVDSPALKILMDIYHQQVQEGNIIANLRQYIQYIGHFHAAGVPGRHELIGGELDYGGILRAIDATGYQGYVGLEYSPLLDEANSLAQPLSLR